MVSSSETVRVVEEQSPWESTSSGEWSRESERGVPLRRGVVRYAKTTVFAFFLLTSPASTVNIDRWLSNRGRDASTILAIAAPSFRRRITLREAREMALQVMYEMENRRNSFAEAEGKRMAYWGETNDL